MAGPQAGVAGESIFARYAYPPNELGYCGPPGAERLLAGGSRPGPDGEVRSRAARFEGAWAYLELLAGAAGVADPLDPAVVSAYWLGGDLLDRVAPGALTAMAATSFGTQPGVLGRLAGCPPAAATASHAFHVFVIYPWVGLLGRGGDTARSVLDSCRIRWGTVVSATGDKPDEATVRFRPLAWDGQRLSLGAAVDQPFRSGRGSLGFVRDLAVGDSVALHWDWICDRLEPGRSAELEDRTQQQLRATNASLAENLRVP